MPFSWDDRKRTIHKSRFEEHIGIDRSGHPHYAIVQSNEAV